MTLRANADACILRPAGRRKLRLINPRSALSTITMPEIIRKMTFSRRALFMPLNLAICAAVVPEGWDAEIIDENVPTSRTGRARTGSTPWASAR